MQKQMAVFIIMEKIMSIEDTSKKRGFVIYSGGGAVGSFSVTFYASKDLSDARSNDQIGSISHYFHEEEISPTEMESIFLKLRSIQEIPDITEEKFIQVSIAESRALELGLV
jgi:hypothetical protein